MGAWWPLKLPQAVWAAYLGTNKVGKERSISRLGTQSIVLVCAWPLVTLGMELG